ncbi:competence protein ComEC [Anaerosolibacter carboniphilus]|uniref:Competence protein ComEC n=1 Tax=Anaerosolibacter carboniphilus TaxID=1417629 RepID=A0A841L044_9FIRM|nr:DNA internalization-related competence protein ComEC/Rec2 [Anaerosolibacter carboniphilus]MBB6217948.1 competence protein ComEC [Anaerosolibacter carboniphilus]
MRRPLIPVVGAYVAGIVLKYWIDNPYIFGAAILLIFFIMGVLSKKIGSISIIICIFLFIGAGNLLLKLSYEGQMVPYWDQEAYMIGDVMNVSYRDTTQLTVKLRELNLNGQNIRLSETVLVKLTGETELGKNIVGKRVGIYGTIREPQGPRNPKTFDYKMYLKTRGIYALIYGQVEALEIIGNGETNAILKGANQIKHKMTHVIFSTLEVREGGFLLGLLLGDKDQLEDEIYEDFQALGAAHVLAVSGLHVGILYMVLNYLLQKTSIKIRVYIVLMALWSYTAITGFSPSVLRAVTMATFLTIGPILNRKYDSLSALLAAAFLFLLANPLLITDIGFQLSFVAVLSIILLYQPILKKMVFMPSSLAQLIAVSLAAQLGTWLIVAYHFNVLSIASVFINIPIVMIVGYLVPAGFAMVIIGILSLPIASFIGFVVMIGIRLMLAIIKISASIPFSYVLVSSPSQWLIIAYFIFVGILILNERYMEKWQLHRKKCLYGFLGICMILWIMVNLLPRQMEVIFVDVGQGDCTLIRTPKGKNLLIDGGGNFYQGVDRKEKNIIVPYLLKNGISKIDIIFASHAHNDHVGGLIQVLDKLRVGFVIAGTDVFQTEDWVALEKECKEKNIEIHFLKKGSEIMIEEDVTMKVLHPDEELIQSSRDDVNNNSLVLLMNYKNKKILWTGDIEAEAENVMLHHYPGLDVNVVKVPHHGSVYSSTEQWIQSIKPEISVFQVGRNSFGHPHPKVIERYNEGRSLIFRNDKHGAIRLMLDEEQIEVYTLLP